MTKKNDNKMYKRNTMMYLKINKPNESHCLEQHQTCHECTQHCIICIVAKQPIVAEIRMQTFVSYHW